MFQTSPATPPHTCAIGAFIELLQLLQLLQFRLRLCSRVRVRVHRPTQLSDATCSPLGVRPRWAQETQKYSNPISVF